MSDNDFWHGDLRLLKVYQQSYYRDVQYRAWWHGQYNYAGTQGAIYNGFSDKAKHSPYKYGEYKDFTTELYAKASKPKITKENLEQEFRKQQIEQQAWLHNLLNKAKK
jgi:hypothetical protein